MIEPEMAFCDLNGDMELAEDLVKYLVRDIRENCPDEIKLFAELVDKEFRATGVCRRAPLPAHQLHRSGRNSRKSGQNFEFPVE